MDMESARIVVFGVGANGAAIAADIARAGHDVTAIDPWPENVEAIRRRGVVVRRADTETIVPLRALHACELAAERHRFDVAILAVKAYDTAWSCELLAPYLSPDAPLVAVQNGLTSAAVAARLGADRTVSAVIEVAASMFEPGVSVQEAPIWLALGGENERSQERARTLSGILAAAGTVEVVDDIRSAKWMKLVANACELVPSAILDLPLADAIAQPGMRELMLAAGEEALATALGAGHHIVPIFGAQTDDPSLTREGYVTHLLDAVLSDYTFPSTLTTVLQDWRKGRRAEIDDLNGSVVDARLAQGATAPVNGRILRLAHDIERGTRSRGIHMIDELVHGSSVHREIG